MVQSQLPILDITEERMLLVPQAVLDRRVRRKKQEVLIHWQGFSPTDATWEDRDFIKN